MKSFIQPLEVSIKSSRYLHLEKTLQTVNLLAAMYNKIIFPMKILFQIAVSGKLLCGDGCYRNARSKLADRLSGECNARLIGSYHVIRDNVSRKTRSIKGLWNLSELKKGFQVKNSIRTLNFHRRGRLNYTEIAGGSARVIGGLLDVRQHQDIFADRQVVFRSQIGCWVLSPFHVGHRRTHSDAGEIQRPAQHHLAHRRWRNREAR